MGDLLSVNDAAFPPAYYETYLAAGQVASDRSLIRGFAGDDVIFGGAGQDQIYGDDGNDLIWSFDGGANAGGSLPETIYGGDGHDRITSLAGQQILVGGSGSDILDGGHDEDTVSYADASQGVTVDLSAGTGYDADRDLARIGEFGGLTLVNDDALTVELSQSYQNPIVLISPYSVGADYISTPEVIATTSTSFTVRAVPEWQFGLDSVSLDYLVIEAGAWELADGTRLAADLLSTASHAPTALDTGYQFATSYYLSYFDSTPTVVTQVQSNDGSAMATRQNAQDSASFALGLQGVEGDTTVGSYTQDVAYVAVEQGASTASGVAFEAATTSAEFGSDGATLSYQSGFDAVPRFFGNLASMNDTDAAFLQRANSSATGTTLFAQEDTSYDSETDHAPESVAYLAIASDAGGALMGRAAPDRLFNIEDLVGSDHDDSLAGDGGANTFTGGQGADSIDGRTGTDTMSYSESGAAVAVDLSGSSANRGGTADGDVLADIENLIGSDYADTLAGDGVDNRIDGGLGQNSIAGGDGQDIFVASLDGDTITDFASGDRIDLSENWYNYNEFSQIDIAVQSGTGSTYEIRLSGSATSATITVPMDAAYSWSADDFILANSDYALDGTEDDDVLLAGRGNNTIRGFGGNDHLRGNAGNDLIYGGVGNETVLGERGADRLEGGAGRDLVIGGKGNDWLLGNQGADRILGGDGNDHARGGPGDDTIIGGRGHDGLRSGAGDDRILGGPGDDHIRGGDGDDTIRGGIGDDRIAGGAGSNVLAGGCGRDTFLFGSELRDGVRETHVITDYQSGIDRIWLDETRIDVSNGAGGRLRLDAGDDTIFINGGLSLGDIDLI